MIVETYTVVRRNSKSVCEEDKWMKVLQTEEKDIAELLDDMYNGLWNQLPSEQYSAFCHSLENMLLDVKTEKDFDRAID